MAREGPSGFACTEDEREVEVATRPPELTSILSGRSVAKTARFGLGTATWRCEASYRALALFR